MQNNNSLVPTKEEIHKTLENRHGIENQAKLSKAKVAIAGLGGLGSNIAFSLARAGVMHLHLIDFDKVDLSNLNRQQYFIEHLGIAKPQALKSELLRINPYLEIRTDCVKITEDNIKDLFVDDEIICEAFDVPENKAMLVNGILETFPDKYLVSGNGMAGYGKSNDIHTRQILPKFYICGDETTGLAPDKPLMASRVAICANHEANMVMQLILNNNDRK